MSRAITTTLCCGLCLGIISPLFAADKPERPPFYRRNAETIKADYDGRIEKATEAITRHYGRRGNAYFFNGQYKKAVADYEKMAQLDPALNVKHWRLGLAYHYAGRYADAAKQLELYRDFDDRDRENGIWIFLSDARALGVKKARKKMVRYTQPDRPPLPDIYQMYEGKLTGGQLLEKVNQQIKQERLTEQKKGQRLFYTHAYIGFLAEVEKNRELARKSFIAATEHTWPVNTGSGPEFMWHCARLRLLEYDREQEAEKSKKEKAK